jgi:hypothetical protein
LEGEDVCLAA